MERSRKNGPAGIGRDIWRYYVLHIRLGGRVNCETHSSGLLRLDEDVPRFMTCTSYFMFLIVGVIIIIIIIPAAAAAAAAVARATMPVCR